MKPNDLATEIEEQHRAAALALARRVKSLPATGECHYCAASVSPGACFCDADCRDDYDREQSARRRNGTAILPGEDQ